MMIADRIMLDKLMDENADLIRKLEHTKTIADEAIAIAEDYNKLCEKLKIAIHDKDAYIEMLEEINRSYLENWIPKDQANVPEAANECIKETNGEHYAKELAKLEGKRVAVLKDSGMPADCDEIFCRDCRFGKQFSTSCEQLRKEWAEETYSEPEKCTNKDRWGAMIKQMEDDCDKDDQMFALAVDKRTQIPVNCYDVSCEICEFFAFDNPIRPSNDPYARMSCKECRQYWLEQEVKESK